MKIMGIEQLIGKFITSVVGLSSGSDEATFTTSDGLVYKMLHYQDCCETVEIAEVIGDVGDLVLAAVIDAREEVSFDNVDGHIPIDDSFTWTFYIIQTTKGSVTIRWLGESNGYYSEEVDFRLVESVH